MSETTRSKSPKKPTDHKPAADDMVSFEWEGVKVSILADAFEDQDLIEDLREGGLKSAVLKLLGAKDAEKVFEVVRGFDSRGRLMSKQFTPFFEAAQEAVGSKNS